MRSARLFWAFKHLLIWYEKTFLCLQSHFSSFKFIWKKQHFFCLLLEFHWSFENLFLAVLFHVYVASICTMQCPCLITSMNDMERILFLNIIFRNCVIGWRSSISHETVKYALAWWWRRAEVGKRMDCNQEGEEKHFKFMEIIIISVYLFI